MDIMELGIEEARKTMNEGFGGPFGAVIVDSNNNVIAVASNTVLKDNDPTAHAEINAIRKACKKLNTHDLTGYKIYATGYPCPMCLSAIIWSNIKEVYYGTDLNDAEKIGFRDQKIYDFINKKDLTLLNVEQIKHDKCLKLFLEYNNKIY
ncbi:MAG: nucleoside deaminase [Candidatus Faecisoma sp.]|nr:nucleoside deaminase [Candidatus Faecisoma sp.]